MHAVSQSVLSSALKVNQVPSPLSARPSITHFTLTLIVMDFHILLLWIPVLAPGKIGRHTLEPSVTRQGKGQGQGYGHGQGWAVAIRSLSVNSGN